MAEKFRGFDPVKGQYVPLDKEAWIKKNKIKEEARQRGEQELPATDSQVLDGTEAKIRAWISERATKCREDVSIFLNDIERDLSNMADDSELKSLTQQIDETASQARTDLLKAKQASDNHISGALSELRDAREAFQKFRQDADLTRPADYSKRRAAAVFLVAVGLAEIILNATLLMDVNAFGLIGSIAQMGLISLINIVAFGLLAGVCIRKTSHVSPGQKFVGWLGMVLILPLMTTFNLLVGHFRDSMQAVVADMDADLAEIGADTMTRLFEGPMDFASFQSLLLVMMGCVCFGLSAWKWWQRDDPYPSYGHEDRELKKREKAYHRTFDRVQKQLEDAIAGHLSWLEDSRHRLEIRKGHWQEKCTHADLLVREFGKNLGQYQLDLDYLLSAYRTANMAARTGDPPARFNAQNHEDKLDTALFEPVSFHPQPNSPVDAVWDNVHEAINSLQVTHREAQESVPTLADIKPRAQAQTT